MTEATITHSGPLSDPAYEDMDVFLRFSAIGLLLLYFDILDILFLDFEDL